MQANPDNPNNAMSEEQRIGCDVDIDFVVLTLIAPLAVEAIDCIEKHETSQLMEHIKEQERLCRSLPAEKS